DARGKLLSLVISEIHAGFRLLHMRPGKPIPGASSSFLHTDLNLENLQTRDSETRQRNTRPSDFGVQKSPTPHPRVSQTVRRIFGIACSRAGDSARILVTARLTALRCSSRFRSVISVFVSRIEAAFPFASRSSDQRLMTTTFVPSLQVCVSSPLHRFWRSSLLRISASDWE